MNEVGDTFAFDDKRLADLLFQDDETSASSHAKPKPPFKRVHSLEIPDESWTGTEELAANDGPLTNDLDAFCSIAQEIFEDEDADKNEGTGWENFTNSDNVGALDELIPVNVRPNLLSTTLASAEDGTKATRSTSEGSPRNRKRRQSRKEQIEDLRQTVSELSQRLDSLRTVTPPHTPVASPPSSPSTQVASILSPPQSLWQRVAERQFKLRHEAEKENATLKDLIAAHKRSNRNIRRMMRRRLNDEMMDEIQTLKRSKLTDSGRNEDVFAELLDGIDERYADLDNLFAAKGMDKVPCPGRKRQVYRGAVDGDALVELMDRNCVPFDFKRTEKAVWEFLQGRKLREGQHICSEEYQQSENTSKSCVGFTVTSTGLASYAKEQRVTRKYTEEGRTVFISRMIAEPISQRLSESRPAGIKFKETMGVVVRGGDTLSSGQQTTIIESHVSIARYPHESSTAPKEGLSTYVDTVAEGWSLKVAFNNQQIENLLFK